MKLIKITGYNLIEFLRQPIYWVTTMLFPSMFFWFFGVPNANEQSSALMLVTSFAAFGCLTVMLFQMAVQIAHERELSWSRYMRTLPINSLVVLGAKVLASLTLALFAILTVFVVGALSTQIDYTDVPVFKLIFAMLAGVIPFGLLGISIGYTVKGNAAVPLANMVHLPLSFAGGLWLPPNALPKVIQNISEYLPTRAYAEILWAIAFKKEIAIKNIYYLLGYFVVFLAATIVLYKRNQSKY